MTTLFHGEVKANQDDGQTLPYSGLLSALFGLAPLAFMRYWHGVYLVAAAALVAVTASLYVYHERRFRPVFEQLPLEAIEFRRALMQLFGLAGTLAGGVGLMGNMLIPPGENSPAAVNVTVGAFACLVAVATWFTTIELRPAYVAYRTTGDEAGGQLFVETAWLAVAAVAVNSAAVWTLMR